MAWRTVRQRKALWRVMRRGRRRATLALRNWAASRRMAAKLARAGVR